MTLAEEVKSGIAQTVPDARVFTDIQLDSRRGEDGERANLVVLHRSGVYLIDLLDLSGMLYGSSATGQWKLKQNDGSETYITDPVQRCLQQEQFLSRKARGIGPYLRPVILYGDDTWIVDCTVDPSVSFSGVSLFLSELMLRSHDKEVIPAAQRDIFAKQLTMLQMLSGKRGKRS